MVFFPSGSSSAGLAKRGQNSLVRNTANLASFLQSFSPIIILPCLAGQTITQKVTYDQEDLASKTTTAPDETSNLGSRVDSRMIGDSVLLN